MRHSIRAVLPYFHPHSIRKTLARLGEQICKSPEDFKAWSQNLGHEKVLTTFLSYGEVACQRQGKILRSLAAPENCLRSGADEIAEAVFERLCRPGVNLENVEARWIYHLS